MKIKLITTALLILNILYGIEAQEPIVAYVYDGIPKVLKNEKETSVTNKNTDIVAVFSFNSYSSEANETFLNSKNEEEIIELKFNELNKIYTYTTPVAPGNPGLKTVIRKPTIYNTVIKLNKHYHKKVKNGEITEIDATRFIKKTLDVALAAFYINTDEFEKVLRNTKEIETISKIFEKAEIINQ
jgi:hypothetical protein